MIPSRLKTLTLGMVAVTLATGCSMPMTLTARPGPTVEGMLADVAQTIILPTYAELDLKGQALHQAALALQATPNEAKLLEARAAWREARAPWELSESHLFGPVKDQDLDPELDSWPVNRSDFDQVLASDVTLDEAFVASQQATLKGFHAIEYLLFANTAEQLTARKLAYLVALTGDFRTTTAKLTQAWDPAGENFVDQYVRPAAGKTFPSPKDALTETLAAMAEICEEVANGKIEAPLAANDKSLEESQFSGNSMEDFINNLRGVQNVYLGRYGSRRGLGLSGLVANNDPVLDAKVQSLIEKAIADLEAVPGTFAEALDQHPGALRKAQGSINAVRTALQKEVSLSLLGAVSADPT